MFLKKLFHLLKLEMRGNYTVKVSNRCDYQKNPLQVWLVTEKMLVNGITADLAGPFCTPTEVTISFEC